MQHHQLRSRTESQFELHLHLHLILILIHISHDPELSTPDLAEPKCSAVTGGSNRSGDLPDHDSERKIQNPASAFSPLKKP
jgi:hypothetical protein